mmetsp:Transcript_175/g.397  ORF Transcript_175/g.397 Transcript_175/m.397 type:complete len:243 (+) Transcript_175:480-1208(+)
MGSPLNSCKFFCNKITSKRTLTPSSSSSGLPVTVSFRRPSATESPESCFAAAILFSERSIEATCETFSKPVVSAAKVSKALAVRRRDWSVGTFSKPIKVFKAFLERSSDSNFGISASPARLSRAFPIKFRDCKEPCPAKSSQDVILLLEKFAIRREGWVPKSGKWVRALPLMSKNKRCFKERIGSKCSMPFFANFSSSRYVSFDNGFTSCMRLLERSMCLIWPYCSRTLMLPSNLPVHVARV